LQLGGYVDVLRRWWLALLMVPLLAGGAAYALANQLERVYETTTTVLVGPVAPNQFDDLRMAAQLTHTYGELVRSELILQRAIREVPLAMTADELRPRVRIRSDVNTRILSITAQQNDPALAVATADSLASGLVAVAATRNGTPGEVGIVNRATLPSRPVQPQPVVMALLAALGAGVAISLLALLWDYFTGRVRGRSELEWISDAPALGGVPATMARRGRRPAATPGRSPAGLAEEYRRLATLLFGQQAGANRSVLVVAADVHVPEVPLGLARAVVENGGSATLIDAVGDRVLPDLLTDNDTTNDRPAGVRPRLELVAGRSRTATAHDPELARVTIVTALAGDTALLASWAGRCEGSIVVARHDRTRRSTVKRVVDDLGILGSRVLGTVLAEQPGTRRLRIPRWRQPALDGGFMRRDPDHRFGSD
jgi:capsular polysaccharide biosynthesis protein